MACVATLTRDDILRAVKIRRLAAKAADPGATEPEAAAYRSKAREFAARYRYGHLMIIEGDTR